MFRKFDEKEDIIGTQQLKSSAQKSIRSKILEQLPLLDDYINDILPKKDSFKLIKFPEHVELIADCDGNVLFIKPRDVSYFPTLRLLHQYPFILPHEKVDKGAIKFVLNGSQIMCRGLTSPGAMLNIDVPENSVVALMAEGKKHALAIGLTKMSAEEILTVNKGIGIENLHHLNDGLWKVQTVL
ncbi:unnamed protein product [Cercopithifilaria johnstoni]|uniref:PUA domain-containing protein n=1 Tax=Cercopithifilaria johnstoni TaxID=2874296 RepID=A0A8J2MII5_9BILA|nr:unnamed protein product [Cercopithifilaria johnstoni]